MTDYIPIIASLIATTGAVGTALIAVHGYKSQKSIDQEAELLANRRKLYQDFIAALNYNIARPTGHAQHLKAHTKMVETRSKVVLIASDDVVKKIGILANALQDSSVTGEEQLQAYAAMVLSMRNESFEESKLNLEQMRQVLPMHTTDTLL